SKTPLVDALAALVPGLAGQSAVSNNHEINRLRLGPVAVKPDYFAIRSNFETENPKWRFCRYFRKDRVPDRSADVVFPGANDLIVDTDSMIDFGVPDLKPSGKCDYGKSDEVWHCNYFRQKRSVAFLADTFRLPMA